jgi:RNA polymerase sigma-70 factor (ECF subfamily)
MKPPLMEDSDIISRCLSGETEAFEMLVMKYQTNLLSLTWSILGNKEEAKDVTQEAFIQAFSSLNRFDRTRSFKNWLFSIACKRCLDRKRKEKSLINFIKKARREEQTSDMKEDKKRNIEDSELFSPVLSKLNNKEQIAISLRVNEGYSAKEIAQTLDCAESTARVYLFNAKRKLRKFFERKEDV